MIPVIRTLSQQLENPLFTTPRDVVLWMGAIQAQDYNMSKWAVGARLASSTITDVENALAKGEILRTHVLRPTWHLVADEDLCWMLNLCKQKLQAIYASYSKHLGVDVKKFCTVSNLIEKMLEGNNHLTRQEIAVKLTISGITVDASQIIHFMYLAETEGIVCSGKDKERKQTYALVSERVNKIKKLQKNESLAMLASKYFKSHSPASIQDFTWWSGLSSADSKLAINLIDCDLYKQQFGKTLLYIHKSCDIKTKLSDCACLLPAFDEYLISYKDRTAVIDEKHQPKAFTKNGIFYPIVMHNGKIVGNWNKQIKRNCANIEILAFDHNDKFNSAILEKAKNKYLSFHLFSGK